MAEPFMGEIRIMSFGFAPQGWAMCNGQFLPINQNQALFSLLGTTYGGNGQTTFALPDLRGRTPIYTGGGHVLGEKGGEQAHTLTISEMPMHIHTMSASATNATGPLPSGQALARSPQADIFRTPISNMQAMGAGTIGNIGGSQAHQNMQPFLTLTFCIALQGIFPSRN